MKILGATVLVLLCTMALCSSQEEHMDITTPCCFSFISRQIPLTFVVDYFETSSQCPTRGVVFVTKRGRRFCADPSMAWVQQYIRRMEATP